MKKRDIDAKDIEILNILQENAILTNKDLSEQVGLSQGPTLVRVQNLFEKGVINKYVAKPNYAYFGYTHWLTIRVVILKEKSKAFIERVKTERQVVHCVHIEHNGTTEVVTNNYAVTLIGKNETDCIGILKGILNGSNNQSLAISYEIHRVKDIIKDTGLIFSDKDCR